MGHHGKKAKNLCPKCGHTTCRCPCPACGETRYQCTCPIAEPDPRGRRKCDSCLCMACAKLTDCPIHPGTYLPSGSTRVSGPVRMNRCSAVCDRVSGGGRVTLIPIKAPFRLARFNQWHGFRMMERVEAHLAEIGPELCPGFVPDAPIPRREPSIPSALARAQSENAFNWGDLGNVTSRTGQEGK